MERRVNKYVTTVYRKKTFTGVYLNWTSLTSRKYKIGVINCLAERAWRICTEEKDRDGEMRKLKTILARNDYPPEIIDETIKRFVERKTRQDTPPAEPEKPVKRFLKLPFVNTKCEDYARRLKTLVTTNYPQVEFNVAFQTPMTLGKLFPFKDNVKNVEDRSLVVYSITCATCGDEYIGKTERSLHYRMKEHQHVPKKSSGDQTKTSSACQRHLASFPSHRIDFSNVKILDTADSNHKLVIKELLHILKRKPAMNVQLGSQSSYEIKTLLIKAYPQFRTGK